jgi:hypothetical protein
MTAAAFGLIGQSHVKVRKIDRFQVYGERRSGTNFIAKSLAQNTGLKRWGAYGWKHAVPYFPVLPTSCLFVVVVRDPFDWLRSFYAGPFEVDPKLAALPFSDFLRAEWEGFYSGFRQQWAFRGFAVEDRKHRGEPNFLDRHPMDGRHFRNVCELRSVKLAGHLSLLDRGLNAVALRYEDFKANPQGMIAAIAKPFDVKLRKEFVAVTNPVGPSSDNRAAEKTRPISDADRDFILRELDLSLERRCGYLLSA